MDDFNKAIAKEYTARDLNCGLLVHWKDQGKQKRQCRRVARRKLKNELYAKIDDLAEVCPGARKFTNCSQKTY